MRQPLDSSMAMSVAVTPSSSDPLAHPAGVAPPSRAVAEPLLVELFHSDAHAVRAELQAGLLAPQPRVSPKFLYDALGSRLFDAITQLPEYYPTRTEAAIVERHLSEMSACLPRGATLIDLGAGDGAKAARLFEPLAVGRYVAVDISLDFLAGALAKLQRCHPHLPMVGVGQDFSHTLALPPQAGSLREPRVLFYPGSSIGNFEPHEARHFLRQVREACGAHPQSGLLIGVDLLKPTAVLEPAYDDALGVTAAFNRNLLLNVNRWLGADFCPAQWQHVAFFNDGASRIEMHLQALHTVQVRWSGGQRRFVAGQRICTEYSYKWRLADFAALLAEAGFAASRHWTDERGWFAVFWAQAQAG